MTPKQKQTLDLIPLVGVLTHEKCVQIQIKQIKLK